MKFEYFNRYFPHFFSITIIAFNANGKLKDVQKIRLLTCCPRIKEMPDRIAGHWTYLKVSTQMKVKIWKKPRLVQLVAQMAPSGHIFHFSTDQSFEAYHHMAVPFKDKKASLYFLSYGQNVAVNSMATQFLNDPQKVIRGTSYLVTSVEERYKMRAWATYEEVADAIEIIGLSARPFIEEVGMRVPQQDIYTTNPDDLFAIKMCL